MLKESKLKQTAAKGLVFLAAQQRDDGSFQSFSSPTIQPFKSALSYSTTFVPALILGCLAANDSAESRGIRRPLAEFVVRQRSPEGSFNYWSIGAPERQTLPYPDDLDDTFCALSSLALHDPAYITQEVLVKAVKLLLAAESKVGGPYRTWLVDSTAAAVWQDVDLAVNTNITFFLSLVSQPLPNLNQFMERAIVSQKLASPYYPSAYPLAYYLARTYQGPQQDKFVRLIQKYVEEPRLTVLDTALLASSLIRVGQVQQAEPLISALLGLQRKDGSWPAEAYCIDPARSGQMHYHGAASLTTAFAIEALSLYSSSPVPPNKIKAVQTTDAILETTILKKVEQQCQELAPDLKNAATAYINKIITGSNGSEIIGIAQQFSKSLNKPLSKSFEDLPTLLGLANLYGWAAYTIYDDFLDDEGKPQLLPIANVAMRYSLQNFSAALLKNTDFQQLVRRTFDSIDGANAWELKHCRYQVTNKTITIQKLPDFGNLAPLAERSLGHTLPPLAVLAAAGVAITSTDFAAIQNALHHYLIARQLNDDAHDWQDDLQLGHITYVVKVILEEAKVKSGTYPLKTLLPKMQKQFWHHTLPHICKEMQDQVRLSRQALEEIKILKSENAITKLLDGLDSSITETLATQADARSFLRSYQKGKS